MLKKNYDSHLKNSQCLLISIAFVILLILFGCATNPPDVPMCVEINPTRGNCVKIMSGETFDVDDVHRFEDQTWWDLRPTMVQLPASSWAQLKAFIIKICKKTNQCDQTVSSWDRTIENVDQQIEKRK